jgi:DNA (cytosine-5)-methyltransferase 1
MRYLSVCSGIEAATVAWHPLGWTPAAFAEIEAFPSAVLAHHYPHVPNAGDFTKIRGDEYGAIDLLVGGTPCQSFSIAGLRGGLDDSRGNLALEFLRLAQRARPRWLVWENVPGVLSSNGGRDFGAILGGMVELGYGFAYRVLDAQFVRTHGFLRAVPQRRRRVFVVGHLGDWRRAAAVLFERESLRGDSSPRREAGKGIAAPIAAGSPSNSGYRNDPETSENLIAGTVSSKWAKGTGGPSGDECQNLVARPLRAQHNATLREDSDTYVPIAFDCKAGARPGFAIGPVPGALRGEGFGGGHAAIAFDTTQITHPENRCNPQAGDPCHPLAAGAHAQAIAFDLRNGTQDEIAMAVQSGGMGEERGLCPNAIPHTLTNWAVRRLTPVECERLQGFRDNYTLVPYRGKPAADSNRYKALGNSMAVNCMAWIGTRIDAVEALAPALARAS